MVIFSVCDTCGLELKGSSSLKRHIIQVHTKDFPHKCHECLKGFRDMCSLKNHTNKHTGEKPFQCKLCNRRYKKKISLKCHIKSIHESGNVHLCSICGKSFSSSIALYRHVNGHNQSFSCQQCEKTDLKRHFAAVHSGEKTIRCKNIGCTKMFVHNSYAKKHEKLCGNKYTHAIPQGTP